MLKHSLHNYLWGPPMHRVQTLLLTTSGRSLDILLYLVFKMYINTFWLWPQ